MVSIFAFFLAFVVAIIGGQLLIPILKKFKFGQEVRDDGPEGHLSKQGTPTMGGLIMIIAILVSSIVFMRGANTYALASLALMLGFGLIGFLDDFIKIRKKRSLGLKSWQKLILQFVFAGIAAVWAYNDPQIGSAIIVPWINYSWDLGVFYIPIVTLFIVGTVNAVNLTDGLDGLVSSVMSVNAIAYTMFLIILLQTTAAMLGDSAYTIIMQIGNLTVISSALVGACIGFLWFNSYPAQVFMGDTGSMALGGILCGLMITSRTILMIFVVGIMFVCSAVSVILQVGSYKLRNKKRVFLMAPLHHHFELKGFPEAKIVNWYTIITIIGAALMLLSVYTG